MPFTLSVKKISVLLSFVGITAVGSAQQFYRTELSAPIQNPANDSAPQRNFEEEKKTWIEIPSERTLNSTTWREPDGAIITQHSSKPLNYFKEGILQPINSNLTADENGWSAMDQPYPVRLNKDGSFELTAENGSSILMGAGSVVNELVRDLQDDPTVTQSGNSVLLENIAPGFHKQLDARENGVKYSYIIPSAMTYPGAYTTIADEFWFDQEDEVVFDESRGYWKDEIWFGDIVVKNKNGRQDFCLHQPLCFDASNNVLACGYKMEKMNPGPWLVTLYIPNAWLQESSRAYPIVIDPLVTGPTALWSGGTMPSCFVPNYNVDSIQVTIPAQITVTAFYVTASFYADPFSTAIMADGDMYFSTTCNQTVHYTIPISNGGNLPGTAYLQSFDMRTPLTCCWPQLCTQQQFYLTMHLGRTAGGSGCNTTYVLYDPNTLWPFTAYIEGHTVEFSGAGWVIPNTPLCSDSCTIIGTAYARYGVPPYTFTHQWMAGSVTGGTPAGCSFGNTSRQLSLTVPNCPQYCDTTSQIPVAPCIITDGCGNIVQGLPNEVAYRKPVPIITSNPQQQTVCSNEPYSIAMTSCLPGTTINWFGNSTTGTGNISGGQANNGTTDTTLYYIATGVLNGCASDTVTLDVTVDPVPSAAFTPVPSPGIAGVPVTFNDQSTSGGSPITSWLYDISTGDTLSSQNPTYTFAAAGNYSVCLGIVTSNGCIDTTCQTIEIIPAEVVAPNVITPNHDGVNDLLVFQYLEYYPTNHLFVYDRWGKLIYDQTNYLNNWDAGSYSDGTYYYVLTIKDKDAMTGFFELLK